MNVIKLRITACLCLCVTALFAQEPAKEKKEPKDDESGKAGMVLPVLIRGPYLQVATPTSMVIRWRTDANARSRVRWGTEPGRLTEAKDDSALTTEHQVAITGLQPHTRYYYSIGAIKDTLQADSSDYFYTLPPSGSKDLIRVGIFGDCGNNSVNQRQVRDQFLKYLDTNYLNAWVLVGDNTYPDGTDAEFQSNFFNIYKNDLLKKYPLFPAPGNHDYHDIEFSAAVAQKTHSVAYYQNFSMPENGEAGGTASHTKAFYSFDIGNAHFLSLDSYGKEDNETRMYDTTGAQVRWIKADLDANKNKGWIIAYFHHPPHTMGSHNSDAEKELIKIRENFIRILERYGVDLVISGHSHDYERSKLMYGYYGKDDEFDPAKYDLSTSSARNDGSADSKPYEKKGPGSLGTVYVVTGSAGKLGGHQASYPHKAMYFADDTHGGASILEIHNERLDFKWICADGVIRDHFTMIKTGL